MHSAIRMHASSTIYCSAPALPRCWKSLRIQSALAHRLASSASCIPGVKTCYFIPISTALYQLADSHLVIRSGFARSMLSSCPLMRLAWCFGTKFVDGLRTLHRKGKLSFADPTAELRNPKRFAVFLDKLFEKDWVVYAKPAFGGPAQVLRYLGRYTHRVAISNHRLLSFDGEHVTFRWRDYAHGNKQKKMTLTALEFLRRLSYHILPRGFVRIRHFGFLTNTRRSALLALARQLITTVLPSVEVCAAAAVDLKAAW